MLPLPCLCTHPPLPGLNFVAFRAHLVPLFPTLPFWSLIELAVSEARLPIEGQRSHCFFVNCLKKWRPFPAFRGSKVLKPDFPASTVWSCCMVCRAPGGGRAFKFICSSLRVALLYQASHPFFKFADRSRVAVYLRFERLHNWRPHICHTNNRERLKKEKENNKGGDLPHMWLNLRRPARTVPVKKRGEHDPRPFWIPRGAQRALCSL